MTKSDPLLTAAAQVDVLDAAGRIIANPPRNAIAASAAIVLALAMATERLWEVCLEADLLVRALRPVRAEFATDAEFEAVVAQAKHRADTVAALMAAIRSETQALTEKEEDDERSHA